MPKVRFVPVPLAVEVDENTKLLVAARRAKADIRFGCASCRCGTCGVRVDSPSRLSPMKDNEQALLKRMKLPLDGSVRLACQARIIEGEVTVDLAFQNTYSPDQGDDESDEP